MYCIFCEVAQTPHDLKTCVILVYMILNGKEVLTNCAHTGTVSFPFVFNLVNPISRFCLLNKTSFFLFQVLCPVDSVYYSLAEKKGELCQVKADWWRVPKTLKHYFCCLNTTHISIYAKLCFELLSTLYTMLSTTKYQNIHIYILLLLLIAPRVATAFRTWQHCIGGNYSR